MRSKKFFAVALIVVMIFSFSFSAVAQDAKADIDVIVDTSIGEGNGDGLNLEVEEIDATQIEKTNEVVGNYMPPRTRGVFQAPSGSFSHTTTLSSSNQVNYYTFNTTGTKFLFFGAVTSNPNVRAWLCFYDPNTGNLYDTGIDIPANQAMRVNSLPADNYCIVVYSTTTLTSSVVVKTMANYTVNYNSSALISNWDDNLAYVQYSIGNSEYVNNSLIFTHGVINNNLEYTYQNGTVVNHYMSVGPAYIKEMSAPISYQSTSGASSSAAVLLYMDRGTAYVYKRSEYNYVPNGVSGTKYSTLDFRMGIETPRAFDWYDVDYPHEQILVYDLVSGRIIDFVGSANYFYHTGAYQASMSYI